MTSYLKLGAVVALLFTLVSIPTPGARAEEEPGYHFTVHNTTKDTITKLFTSEDEQKDWPLRRRQEGNRAGPDHDPGLGREDGNERL